jgi:hypothetical protein
MHATSQPNLLAPYAPPNQNRAALAATVAPALVLLTFAAVLFKWIDLDQGFAVFAACTAWVAYEMHVYQTTIDTYNEDYVSLHLAWRSAEALNAMLDSPCTAKGTRVFVDRFLQAQSEMLHNGQVH